MIRKQEIGVYSPMIQVTKAKDPLGFYALVISFDCDPKRKDSLILAVREELHKLQKEGVIQEELDKFISEESRKYELQAKSNQFWLSYLKGQWDKKESLDQFLKYPHLLKTIHLKEINKYCHS
ncbi:insulinase family protein [Sphingobacterium sp. JUb78]|uniref:insulinase family protein n=1 Tax=Sphingobacterium sp. JUb78 TaxID=2485111 RepID=UPI002938D769|nr:insulinase family protein [Sphingobacterium sp. JUb78]